MNINKQLEEVQLLQCSLLPGEIFNFVFPADDLEEWSQLLNAYTENGSALDRPADWQPSSTCRFEVRIQNIPVWFEVELPRDYPDISEPLIYVRGEALERAQQERWQTVATKKLAELKKEDTDFIVQNLLCLYLIPFLHANAPSLQNTTTSSQPPNSPSSPQISRSRWHALLTSHHLISPTKRRLLQKWSAELSITGFAKVGYPGAIYAEGADSEVEEFVRRIKEMQWLALRVRFEEELDERVGRLRFTDNADKEDESEGRRKGKWVELEKVGAVVEIMRRSGREEYVTEMGLGSASTAS